MSILEKLPKEYKIKFALNISYSSPDDIKKMLNQMQGLQKDQILEITLAYEKLDLNKTQIKRLNNYLGNSNLLKKIKPVNTRKTINRIIKMIL